MENMENQESELLGYSNPVIPTPTYNGTLTSPILKETDVVGADIMVNGSLDNWTEGVLDTWTDIAEEGSGVMSQENTIRHTASGSSVKLTLGAGDEKGYLKQQVFTGLTPGATYILDAWGYIPSTNTGAYETVLPAILVLNGDVEDGADAYWDFTTRAFVEGELSLGFTDFNTQEDAWESLAVKAASSGTNTIITAPASGTISVCFLATENTSVEGDIVYFDDVSLKAYTIAPAVELLTFENVSDWDNLVDTDVAAIFETTGGTPHVFGRIYKDGSGELGALTWNASGTVTSGA